MIQRWIPLIISVWLLSGCDEVITGNTATPQLFNAFSPATSDPRFDALAKAGAPALKIGFVDAKAPSPFRLEQRLNGVETWLGAGGASLTIERGMIRGTQGLGAGLLASEVSQPLALVLSRQVGSSDRFHTYLTGDNQAVTRTFRCVIENDGPREVDLELRMAQTTLMKESCRGLDQSFLNLYWVESRSGMIVQSRQWTGDFIGPISTQVVE